jgi:uncharacterized protein YggU (UPF0235/DUF167 family)
MGHDAAPKVRLSVRAKPRAKKSRVVRAEGLSVEVALAAPPVDGAANAELLVVLAEALGIPRKALHLAVGAGSKRKLVEVHGLQEEEVVRRLAAVAGQ